MEQLLVPLSKTLATELHGRFEPSRCRGNVGVFIAADKVSSKPGADEAPAEIRWLNCAHCGRKIARCDDRIQVNDKHEHTFINPAGVIYKIGCFSSAPGAVEVGQASAEFAWFRGQLWRCVCCSDCETHLGWTFTSDASRFFGLILGELRDAGGA